MIITNHDFWSYFGATLRGLFIESCTFQMEAKLFLSCNALPPIKGEDTALWRRVRVVKFTSKFIDKPIKENEFLINRNLHSIIQADNTWKQTFFNILLEYYYKEIPEPDVVIEKTNEYQESNDDFELWCKDNIIFNEGSFLQLKQVVYSYTNIEKPHSTLSNKIKLQLESHLEKHFINEQHVMKKINIDKRPCNGWRNFKLI